MNASKNIDPVIAGKSPEITVVKKTIKILANQPGNVLLIGEVGAEKKKLAKMIHQMSKRRNHPFVSIECGALGDTIDVDDVFPYSSNHDNFSNFKFFSAGKGTVFLNNVNRLNSELQDKLYNFLVLLSNNPGDYQFESRIIASADPTIEEDIRNSRFRTDLFQLIGEYRIQLPPIRERKQDIPHIFAQYLEQFCEEFGKPIPVVPFEVFEAMLEYDWPGNITELRNCVRNLLIMSPDGELSPDYLPFRVQPNPLEALAARDLPSAVMEVEKFLIRKALARFEGNQSKAARVLQVSEAALRYKMKKYGLAAFK